MKQDEAKQDDDKINTSNKMPYIDMVKKLKHSRTASTHLTPAYNSASIAKTPIKIKKLKDNSKTVKFKKSQSKENSEERSDHQSIKIKELTNMVKNLQKENKQLKSDLEISTLKMQKYKFQAQ